MAPNKVIENVGTVGVGSCMFFAGLGIGMGSLSDSMFSKACCVGKVVGAGFDLMQGWLKEVEGEAGAAALRQLKQGLPALKKVARLLDITYWSG